MPTHYFTAVFEVFGSDGDNLLPKFKLVDKTLKWTFTLVLKTVVKNY